MLDTKPRPGEAFAPLSWGVRHQLEEIAAALVVAAGFAVYQQPRLGAQLHALAKELWALAAEPAESFGDRAAQEAGDAS